MFFSVIVASYNAGEKLHQTIESVLAQTCSDYEVIVKDALSADGSADALAARLEEQPGLRDRIRLVREKDGGIYDGMNRGAALARGEYVYFLNCGDVLHDKDVLAAVRAEAEALAAAGETGPLILYGDVVEAVSGQRVAANPRMSDAALYRNIPNHQACFYSRALLEARGFDTSLRVRADYEHFLWCVKRGGARAVRMDIVVADYEGGGFSETAENRRVSAAEHRAVTARYLPLGTRLLCRAYMVLTLQPLREKLSRDPKTAAFYQGVKRRIYGR